MGTDAAQRAGDACERLERQLKLAYIADPCVDVETACSAFGRWGAVLQCADVAIRRRCGSGDGAWICSAITIRRTVIEMVGDHCPLTDHQHAGYCHDARQSCPRDTARADYEGAKRIRIGSRPTCPGRLLHRGLLRYRSRPWPTNATADILGPRAALVAGDSTNGGKNLDDPDAHASQLPTQRHGKGVKPGLGRRVDRRAGGRKQRVSGTDHDDQWITTGAEQWQKNRPVKKTGPVRLTAIS